MTLAGSEVEVDYPGPGHTIDNLVVWVPSERLLYAGCLIKELASKSLGNVADADIPSWTHGVEQLMQRFGAVRLVVPGHGETGGPGLLGHTLELLRAAVK